MNRTPSPPIRALFRYRDLFERTLEAHRDVIQRSHKVWWGWLKRPVESPHLDIWKELEQALSGGEKHLPIGLYDSGTDQVHVAWIDQVKPPQTDAFGDYTEVPLSAEEREFVPEYYRASPFSRAWVRIIRIDQTPLPFFGQYSFGAAPDLPHFPPEELKALENKVILDGRELRNMDTTLWCVRPRQDTDHEERVLTFGLRITEPVSRQPIATRGNLILHLTDPHFAAERYRDRHVWRLESESGAKPTLKDAILAALDKELRSRIGLILVTGDLTFLNTAAEFSEAHYSLTNLYRALSLGPEHVVIIPGNHDLTWTQESTYNHEAKVQLAPEQAMERYRAFYQRFYQHEAHPLLCMGRRFILPPGTVLDVCALNSSSLEQGKNFLAGMGRVQESSFQTVLNELGWQEAPGLALRLLALHHHLVPTEDLETPDEYAKGFGMAIDAPRIQRLAAKYGVQLALHGHKHRLFVWKSGVYELPEDTQDNWYRGELSIVGGGSAGSQATDGGKNYFNLLEVQASAMTLHTYKSRNASAFSFMSRWRASLSLRRDRLILGPWLRAEDKDDPATSTRS